MRLNARYIKPRVFNSYITPVAEAEKPTLVIQRHENASSDATFPPESENLPPLGRR